MRSVCIFRPCTLSSVPEPNDRDSTLEKAVGERQLKASEPRQCVGLIYPSSRTIEVKIRMIISILRLHSCSSGDGVDTEKGTGQRSTT